MLSTVCTYFILLTEAGTHVKSTRLSGGWIGETVKLAAELDVRDLKALNLKMRYEGGTHTVKEATKLLEDTGRFVDEALENNYQTFLQA